MKIKQIDKQKLIKQIQKSNLSDQHKRESIAFVEASSNRGELVIEFLRTLRAADTIKDFIDIFNDNG